MHALTHLGKFQFCVVLSGESGKVESVGVAFAPSRRCPCSCYSVLLTPSCTCPCCLQALEQFSREARAMSMSLDSAASQLTESLRGGATEPRSPADVLRHERHLRQSVINGTENLLRQGASCYAEMGQLAIDSTHPTSRTRFYDLAHHQILNCSEATDGCWFFSVFQVVICTRTSTWTPTPGLNSTQDPT